MKKTLFILQLAWIITICLISQLFAATRNVPGDYPTIQAGIDAASDGDIVLVSPGTYAENIDFAGKAIVVISEHGPENTTIDGGGKYSGTTGVKFHSGEDYGSVIEGFTITNCERAVCFGVWESPSLPSSSPMIIKNILYDNHYGIHGYVNYQTEAADPFIARNIIDSNWCGIWLDHQAFSYGGANAVIRNNTIVNNTHCGIKLRMHQSLPKINSNIIANNDIGIEFTYDSIFEQRKELVWYNNIWGNNNNFTAGGSDVDMNGIQGNISSDPLFLDPGNRDYHLQAGSPCINTGNPDPKYNDPDDTRNDMGGYGGPIELIDTIPPGQVTIISSSPAPQIWSNDNTVKVTWTPATDEGISGLNGYSFVWDTNPATDPDMIKDIRGAITSVTSEPLPDGNEHYFHIRAVDRVNNWGETVHCGPFFIDSTIQTKTEYEAVIIEPPPDYERSYLYGINNSGQAVGRLFNYNTETEEDEDNQAFIWDSTNGIIILPTLSGDTSARHININGQAAGYSYNADGFIHAVRWDDNGTTIVDIGTFYNPVTPPSGKWGDSSSAFGINDSGQVTGYADIPNDAGDYMPYHAFIYDDINGIQDLGTLEIYYPQWQNGYSVAYQITNNNQVVGTAHKFEANVWVFRAFIYDEENSMQELSFNPDYRTNEWQAVVINEDGLIGGHVIIDDNPFPYYWDTKSVPEPIQISMPADFPYGEIYGINSSGQMVGAMWDDNENYHAFLFDVTNGIKDLNDLTDLSAESTLKIARDINDSGQIAGFGEFNGQKYGFILNSAILNAVDDEMAVDFGSTYGLYHYDQTNGWTQINTADPGEMVSVDIDNDGQDELAVGFAGYGLYTYDETNGWTQINTVIPECMIAFGGTRLACDFGSTYGLYTYDQANGWTQLNTADPGLMVSVDIDGDGQDELAVSFAGYGLYTYNETNGWTQINTVIPEGIIATNLFK